METTRRFQELALFRLQMLSRVTERLAEMQYRQDFGLTLLQARVIGVVGEFSALPFGQVVEKLELEKAQASRLIAGLIERGFLEKPPGKRAAVICLTPAGRQMWDSIYEGASGRNRGLLAGLSPEEAAVFDRCLSLLAAQAQSMAASPQTLAAQAKQRPQRATSAPAERQISIVLDREFAAELQAQLNAALDTAPDFPSH